MKLTDEQIDEIVMNEEYERSIQSECHDPYKLALATEVKAARIATRRLTEWAETLIRGSGFPVYPSGVVMQLANELLAKLEYFAVVSDARSSGNRE